MRKKAKQDNTNEILAEFWTGTGLQQIDIHTDYWDSKTSIFARTMINNEMNLLPKIKKIEGKEKQQKKKSVCYQGVLYFM